MGRPLLLLVLVAITVLGAAASPAGSAASSRWRDCRPLKGVQYRYVRVRKVSCRYARPFLRRMQRSGYGRYARNWDCTDDYKRLSCVAVDGSRRQMVANWLDEG
jgi:hypothetical protein